MTNKKMKRTTKAAVAATLATTLAIPAVAVATSPAPASNDPGSVMQILESFVSPLPPEQTQELVDYVLQTQGPDLQFVHFSPESSPEQRMAAIESIDRTMMRIRDSGEGDAILLDSITVWESLTPEQKEAVLSDPEAMAALWTPAVTATAAAAAAAAAVVTAVVEVVRLTHELTGPPEPDEEGGEEEEGESGTIEDEEDDDAEAIRGALGY